MINTSNAVKCFPNPVAIPPVNDTSDFTPTGYIEIANSGKTVKIFVYNNNDNGKRCFVGQVPCRQLRVLLDNQSLKVDICKYRKTNKGEVCDRAK